MEVSRLYTSRNNTNEQWWRHEWCMNNPENVQVIRRRGYYMKHSKILYTLWSHKMNNLADVIRRFQSLKSWPTSSSHHHAIKYGSKTFQTIHMTHISRKIFKIWKNSGQLYAKTLPKTCITQGGKKPECVHLMSLSLVNESDRSIVSFYQNWK